VHIGSLAFALLLRVLSPVQAVGFGIGAVVFNLWILPRVGRGLFRPSEHPGRVRDGGGIVIYPIAVLALVTLVGAGLGRMDVAAGAWAAMAVGDGVATAAGRAWGRRRLPWSIEKTWNGTIAFALAGWMAVAFFLAWVGGWSNWTPHPVPLLAAAGLAACAAALVESLPLPVDDNWTVPATASLVLLACATLDPARLAHALNARDVAIGLGVAGALGVLAYLAGSVSVSGCVGGVVLGALAWSVSGGWAFVTLAAFFVLASAATRVGWRAKERRGLAEARRGRRGARHAWANGFSGVALAAVATGAADPAREWLRVGSVAAFATAAADTLATEIGQWLGGPTWSARTGRRVAPGTPGGVGVTGTAAGLIAAALVALTAHRLGVVSRVALPLVVAAAALGSLVESVLGARIAPGERTALTHDALNVTNTAAGGVIGILLAAWFT
jgi:uncharacterized protein (TIGR00297 family)